MFIYGPFVPRNADLFCDRSCVADGARKAGPRGLRRCDRGRGETVLEAYQEAWMSENWSARHAALASAEGDDWERLNDAFRSDWTAAYSTVFVNFAISYITWMEPRERGKLPEHLSNDALIFGASRYDYCPRRTAEADVVECEQEEESI
jgi:hypothetical protein